MLACEGRQNVTVRRRYLLGIVMSLGVAIFGLSVAGCASHRNGIGLLKSDLMARCAEGSAISVFLAPNATNAELSAVESHVVGLPGVAVVGYVTKDMAFREYEIFSAGQNQLNVETAADMPTSVRAIASSSDASVIEPTVAELPSVLKVTTVTQMPSWVPLGQILYRPSSPITQCKIRSPKNSDNRVFLNHVA